MKNLQRGFIVPALIAVIALLVIGGGVYVYETKKAETPASIEMQQSNQPQQTPGQNNPVNLPVQKTPVSSQTNTSGWKKYSDASLSFEYPALISAKQDGGTITLGHSVAYKHPNLCDFKGDAPPLDRLGDFGASLKVVNQNLKDFVQSSAYPGWDYVSKNPFTFGSLSGYKVSSGVEGCGEDIYYLTISSTQTLVIHRGYVAEFNSINGDYQTYLNLPGIISPSKGEEYFNHILSTLKFIASPKPDIIVLSPNGGEGWIIGQTYTISVATKGDLGTKTVRLNRYSDDGVRVGEQTIGTMQANTFSFNVPIGTDETRGAAGRYKIQVVSDKYNSGLGVSDESDNYFSITNQQTEKVQVYVNIVDKDGNPFKPDRVEWYYPPVNGQATQYPAKCTNEACTRWSVTGATASKIYVVANYKKPSAPGAACFSQAYDAKPVELSSVSTEITLTMGLESYCY